MSGHGNLDDLYLEWLYSLVGSVRNRNPSRSYWELLKQLHTRPFTWFIPNDDNRVSDGRDLRLEFLDEQNVEGNTLWLDLECSVLEMIIALSRRVAYESYGTPAEWFWQLIQNLELREFTDDEYTSHIREEVDDTLDNLIDRDYARDGTGGLFPLRTAVHDQRQVEIWYQMSAYLLENEYVDNGP